ncbi:uncharacterized protein LOC131669864 [Phymastichus coffea]|uniref:uncharacterized protein LOC131669864 n=1 Tax=Phymastichus coffea TaxID=108790 RepID=UPI00273C52CB|nr:uncharacterized protein LOC131669864 [Phymastichus coffea]
MLITAMYDITKPIFMMDLNDIDYIDLSVSVFYFLQCILPLLILTTTVASLTKESRKMARTVDDCLEIIQDEKIKETLSQFFNCLLHTNVKFTVFDWFALDGTLLMSMTGSITTYLVIIFEFQMQGYSSCN